MSPLIIHGNIDPFDRPVIRNADGSVSTTLSFSVSIDGEEVLLPRIVNGEVLTEKEAVLHFVQTGEHLGIFNSPEEADAYATALHDLQVQDLQAKGLLL